MIIYLTIKKFEDVEKLYTNIGLDIPTKEKESYILDCDLKLRQKLYSQDWFFKSKSNEIELGKSEETRLYMSFNEIEELLEDTRFHFKNDLNVWVWLTEAGLKVAMKELDNNALEWIDKRRSKYTTISIIEWC
jgi:hypothetical protein